MPCTSGAAANSPTGSGHKSWHRTSHSVGDRGSARGHDPDRGNIELIFDFVPEINLSYSNAAFVILITTGPYSALCEGSRV